MATHKQTKHHYLQEVGTEIAFLQFLRKIMGSKQGLCLSHEAGFTWLEYCLLIICRDMRLAAADTEDGHVGCDPVLWGDQH